MPNTYSQIYIQLVFAVKGRECLIKESFREEIQKYISGIITQQKQKLYAIYCMPDHTHILISLKPDIAIADLVRDIKANTSSFIKEKGFIKSFKEEYIEFLEKFAVDYDDQYLFEFYD
jgi:putative transposase